MPGIEYSIFGSLVVRLAPDAAPLDLGPKLRMALGRMLLEPGVNLATATLAEEVWGDEKQLKNPVNSVHQVMKQLRERLGDADRKVIVRVDGGYRLDVPDKLLIDVHRFRALVRRGRALAAGHPRVARVMLAEALRCRRGPLLGDHAVLGWAAGHAIELESLQASAAVDYADVRLALGEYKELEGELRRQLREHPDDERRRAQLVRALDGDGRAAEAGLAYREATRELGAPGPELRVLGDRIGRGLPAEPPRSVSVSRPSAPDALLLWAVLEPRRREEHDAALGTVALIVDREGGEPYPVGDDQLVAAFADPAAAVRAAEALVADARLRPAVALHRGGVVALGDRLLGPGPARARRLARAAHHGQVLVSRDARAVLPSGLALSALGEQRLDDLLPGEPLFALGPGEFPAPDTLDTRPNNLPVQPTRFIGRARELAEVSRSIAAGQLVTLFGVGGYGKTRLALALAAGKLCAFGDGAWFVGLAELDAGLDAESLAAAIGNQLGVRPLPDETAATALARHFSDRVALLVLDNCEHVLGGLVELVPQLRAGARGLCVLATSRFPLRIAGERVVEVPAMASEAGDDPDVLPDALELLLERAGPAALSGDPETLALATRICQAVEGSPLAIELVAAHVATRGLAGVAAEVEEAVRRDRVIRFPAPRDPTRPRRQLTMEATIRWSHALLSEHERRILHRLAVFRGSFAVEAAQLVAADDELGPACVAELTGNLIERSMVAAEPPLGGERRVRLSQPILAFALAELSVEERERTQRRHAEVFVELAARLAPRLFGTGEHAALERLEADHDNLRLALTRLVEREDAEGALTVVGALWWLWFSHGHFAEGAQWVERVLALDPRPSRRRVRALRAGSHLSWWRGDYAQAAEYNAALEACAEAIDDAWGLAWAPLGHGAVLMFPDPPRALVLCEESRRRFEAIGRPWEAAYAQQMIAAAHWFGGDEGAAGGAYEAAAETFERLGHRSVLASARRGAGLMAARCGQHDRGDELCRDALRITSSIGDRAGSAQALNFLAAISRARNDLITAGARFADALVHAREIGELWATCSALDGIAGCARRDGEPELAVRLLARSGKLAQRAGYVQAPHERALRTADVLALIELLGERDYERAATEGELMSDADAVASALAFVSRHAPT